MQELELRLKVGTQLKLKDVPSGWMRREGEKEGNKVVVGWWDEKENNKKEL